MLIGLAGAAALAMGGIAVGLSWPTRPFERAELRFDSLMALDREGRAVWSFRLPECSAEGSVKGAPLIPKLREAAPVDLDGDGEQELVAFVDFYDLLTALAVVATNEEARTCVDYVTRNRDRMRYPEFRAQRLCISRGRRGRM